jgi:hypothetical protein
MMQISGIEKNVSINEGKKYGHLMKIIQNILLCFPSIS